MNEILRYGLEVVSDALPFAGYQRGPQGEPIWVMRGRLKKDRTDYPKNELYAVMQGMADGISRAEARCDSEDMSLVISGLDFLALGVLGLMFVSGEKELALGLLAARTAVKVGLFGYTRTVNKQW